MITIDDNFGFYGILTAPLKGYEYLTKLLVDSEVKFIQLREKNKSEYEILKIAELMRKITEGSNSSLIINDYPQVAIDCEADGIHVGQNDMTVAEVRRLVGNDMIVGLSTHNPTETENSNNEKVHYVGVGPVFPTPTKKIPDPVLGIETMAEMVNIANVPAVTLGGIGIDDIETILKGGARNFSMVRPLCSTENPQESLKKILDIYKSFIGKR